MMPICSFNPPGGSGSFTALSCCPRNWMRPGSSEAVASRALLCCSATAMHNHPRCACLCEHAQGVSPAPCEAGKAT